MANFITCPACKEEVREEPGALEDIHICPVKGLIHDLKRAARDINEARRETDPEKAYSMLGQTITLLRATARQLEDF